MKSSDMSFVIKHLEAYREAGHDISYTPEVLYLDYWWNYKILDSIDVATYVTLQLFGKKSIKFSIEWLAAKSGCSVATLQQRLDNLEND
jgi:hypothetical protein